MTNSLKSCFVGAAISAVAVATMSFAAPASAALLGYELTFNESFISNANGVNNVPDLRLTNISDLGSGFQITDFTLTIGDIAFNYDFVRNQSAPIDALDALIATLNSPDLNNDTSGMDFIDYDFLGFDPSDAWQFEVDVDPDVVPSVVQDYRDIVFPTGMVTVGFSNGTILSQTLVADTGQDGYTFRQSIDVPEPATLALFGTFALAGAGLARRKRA